MPKNCSLKLKIALSISPQCSSLGYNITKHGTHMDEGKVEAVKNWPIPTNIKELQFFLGFANFYQHLIQN